MTTVPTINDITLAELSENPYPIYARLRKQAPIAWVPAANIILVTRFDTIKYIDTHPEFFPAFNPQSLQIRAMGHSMMRKDGEDHRLERAVLQKSVNSDTIQGYWMPRFERIVDELIDGFRDKCEADLFTDFAAPMASLCLMEILGLTNVNWQDLCDWSQTLMDAVGNYGDDPQIWARQQQVSSLIDKALDQMIEIKRATPDPTFISQMANSETLSLEQIRANVKVIIGGGINEPRDATCTALYGLLSNPEQLSLVREQPSEPMWGKVFEEAIRYCAPIGMYPRRVAKDMELEGVALKRNDQLGLVVASACHDEKYWDHGDRFDINRKRCTHLAFGTGPHLCLGFRTARMQVGQLSVPSLIARLPGLRLNPEKAARFGGWVFRGPLSLPVKWNL
ncbi:cytochrome P450 [Pseudomaricurvus alkylphenolicus]|uniref:cytochrome P450 n=1 Tax=Pseudomaricurvus alkylphenolicus TaxID=1306991 RepID=UPI001421BE07|nr:cytochrome P450 [Pseudomaricurvus alkylphenolicus]